MAVLKKARGLHTFNNEINEVEGALDIADNIVIDADDIIESRRGFSEFGTSFGTASDKLKQILVYKDRVLRHYNSTLEVDTTGEGNFVPYADIIEELESNLRIKSQESNGNLFFTTKDGIKKISAKNAAELSTSPIVDSGGAKALDISASVQFTSGGFLPPESKCAYRLIWGIRDNNNNLIFGAPSSRFVLSNTSEDVNNSESFEMIFTSNSVSDYDNSTPERFVTFSSSETGYFLWFSTIANPDVPQAVETVGRTAIEVNIEGLSSSAAIAVATATAISNSLDGIFSAEVTGSTVTVVSLEPGSDLEDAASSAALSVVTTNVLNQGAVTEGLFANAVVTVTVPSQVTSTEYFYQLYRTAAVTATVDLALDDIDPGDEMNLVFESNMTAAEITAGELTFTDITSESFRASGAFLYTNPNTGEGILQANEKPPIAKDIELFRNSVFYANTKTVHRFTLNLLSVSAFTSGVSDLIIGNSSQLSEYTFVGTEEVSEVTTDSFANTDDTGYILLNSANDERGYYLWIDKGSTSDPTIAGRIGIRVQIETGDTDIQVATKVANIVNLVTDFSASSVDEVVTISNIKNGNTTDISIGSPLTNNWAVAVVTQGDGENAAANEVLLSSNPSVALSIDETARSLVQVINKDAGSPVNAFYISGPEDLPGIILLEAKSLEDDPFFIATSDPNITGQFNPEVPTTETITTIATGSPTQITSAGHGLVNGDTVYIYNTDSVPAIQGEFVVSIVDPNIFTIPFTTVSAGVTGIWFKTDSAFSDNEESANRLYYSKVNQPEAVPIVNFIDIGPRDKVIQRILALRDNLFVMKEDGIYIITGTTAPNFDARLLDGSAELIAPDSAVVLNNKIYALTTQGIVTITEGGVEIISRPIEDRILKVVNSRFNFEGTSFGIAYESDRSYILYLPTLQSDNIATQAYRYNTFTRTWTRWTNSSTCGIVNPGNDLLYIGPGDRNFIDQERKNDDRTDYADRDFTLTIGTSGVTDTNMILSAVNELASGDVLVQTQYLTIARYNRLTRRLDLDNGLDDNDYSSLQVSAGANLTNAMTALNAKLETDDSSGTITPKMFSTDFETLQTQYNQLIAELNDPACDTVIKSYKLSEGTIPYEAIIQTASVPLSLVTLNESLPFIEGPIQAFKAIKSVFQYSPQHFGASDLLKQVREGTIIFDQTNFYSGRISYSSDLSFNFESIDFLVQGVGFWGGNVWGEGTWGGEGNEVPVRTLIPKQKQRCRHLKVRFEHFNAREIFRVLGISLEPRPISKRAYR